MRIYLDIDGVLLQQDAAGNYDLIPNIEKFLKYIRKNFDCYWLSTHSKHCAEDAQKYLRPFLDRKRINLKLIDHIKSVSWKTLKTEAIDFSEPFIWIDDAPLPSEIRVLKKKGCERCLLIVHPEQDLIIQLKKKAKEFLRF